MLRCVPASVEGLRSVRSRLRGARVAAMYVAAGMLFSASAARADPALGVPGTPANQSGSIATVLNQLLTQTVNTATGNLHLAFSDFITPGPGLRFRFVRSYNTQDSYSGPLGRGWTHSYNILLTVAASGAVTIKWNDGREEIFQPGEGGSFTAPSGIYDVLVQTGPDTYRLTRPDQVTYWFAPAGAESPTIRLQTITDRNGNTQSLSYDSNANLVVFTDVGGRTFAFSYDALHRLTALHDPALDRTLVYSYNEMTLIAFGDAAAATSRYRYNDANLLTEVADARGNAAVVNVFDRDNRIVQSACALGGSTCITRFVYGSADRNTTIIGPGGGVTTHYHDASMPARLIKVVRPLGSQTTFTYDGANTRTSETNSLGQITTYTYDAHGNRTSISDPLGNTTRFLFDSHHNIVESIDAGGNTTLYSYDVRGNLVTVRDALGGTTRYTYDSSGNRTASTNATGQTTTYTYDAAGRLLTVRNPLLHATSFTYDAGGRLTSRTEPAGNRKSLAYDLLDRIVAIGYTRGSTDIPAGPVGYTYDANGNRARMTDATGTTSYSYDSRNRVTSIDFPGGGRVSYSYDCSGARTAMSYAGKIVEYGYDAEERLVAVRDGTATTTYTYDAAGNVLRIEYPNGAAVGYSYDGAGRLVAVHNSYVGSEGAPISSFVYALDAVGNRVQMTDGSERISTYAYDRLHRLTRSTVGAKSTSYTYDAVGNRLTLTAPSMSVAYAYDAAGRLVSAGPEQFVYDGNGNQKARRVGLTEFTYSYDAANRLMTVNGGRLSSAFVYDGDGNRVAQSVGAATYSYLNDISTGFTTVLQESGPDGALSYVRGRGLISVGNPGLTNYYHYDAQSSVMGLTDSSGHLVRRYAYDAWGTVVLTVPARQSGLKNRFAFTGEALDPGTSLYYLRARYYDPSLGRFITQDPVVDIFRAPQTLNMFVYARNNPVTLTHRTGLCVAADNFTECEMEWPDGPPQP